VLNLFLKHIAVLLLKTSTGNKRFFKKNQCFVKKKDRDLPGTIICFQPLFQTYYFEKPQRETNIFLATKDNQYFVKQDRDLSSALSSPSNISRDGEARGLVGRVMLGSREAVGVVVGGTGLVVGEAHGAVALVVADGVAVGAVDGQLQVVGPQPVTVGVGVREQTTLPKYT